MADAPVTRLWISRAVYVGLALALMLGALLPLNTMPRLWAAPDFLLALTFAWVVRRPDILPVWLIALVLLLSDFLFGRPPGLWTALVVIGSEMLRARAPTLRNLTFPAEWITVAAVTIAMVSLNRIALAAVLVPQAGFALAMIQLTATLAAYPLVVALSHSLLGVRKIAPGGANRLGQKT